MSMAVSKTLTPAVPIWRRAVVLPFRRAETHGKSAAAAPAPWLAALGRAFRAVLAVGIGLVVAGVLAITGQWLSDARTLPLRAVQVEGVFEHVSAEAVRTEVASVIQGNFITVDLPRVQAAVEALPWVRYANVQRVWPDVLSVTVTEQVPLARWGRESLLNEAGLPFTPPAATFPTGLPGLHGPRGSGRLVALTHRDMSEIVAPLGHRIESLNLDERRAWSLTLDDGMRVMLGRGDGYQRLLRFVRFYHRALQGRAAEVELVDLRYSNGFAVRWKDAESALNGATAGETKR